jgi:hypothetical protein
MTMRHLVNYYIVGRLTAIGADPGLCIKTRCNRNFFADQFHFVSNFFAPLLLQIRALEGVGANRIHEIHELDASLISRRALK